MRNVRKLVSYALVLVGLMLLMPLSGGCTGKGEQENTFLELLTLLPASAKEAGGFALIDYKRIWQANGIPLYTSDNQKVSREEFHNSILDMWKDGRMLDNDVLGFGSFYTGWSRYMVVSTIQDKYMGYDVTDIYAEINNINMRPDNISPDNKFNFEPGLMVAAIGTFNPQATKDAFNNRKEWPSWAIDNYTTENFRDIIIHSWGDGNEEHLRTMLEPPHLDMEGRARPLAVSDRHLFVSSTVENVKAMINSSKNKSPSLADVPEYAMAAQGMYDLNVYGAIIVDEALANGGWENPELYTDIKLKKFLTCGTGFGRDEIGVYIALVLVHESSDKATENVLLLEQLIETSLEEWTGYIWSLSDYIYDTEIHSEGEVLLAKLYTDDEALWHSWFFNRWPLVLHEE